jgi:hypothetical protein
MRKPKPQSFVDLDQRISAIPPFMSETLSVVEANQIVPSVVAHSSVPRGSPHEPAWPLDEARVT